MKPLRLLALLTISITLACSMLGAEEDPERRVHEVAQPRRLPEGAPKASDVIMRSLTLRVAKRPDQHDTFRALTEFHVTRLEWAYIVDPRFIERVRASGRFFGGAASSALSHIVKPEGMDYADLACVDLHGEPVIPTWKRGWRPPGNLWMCANNPAVERAYLDYLKACLDAGAEVMQRDEPGGNENAVHWGGCFCEHCMRQFREYLQRETSPEDRRQFGIGDLGSFDYRQHLKLQGAPVGDAFRGFDGGKLKQQFIEFQTRATVAFHNRTRRALDQYAGRRVPFSCNNGCRRWTPIEMEFDWAFGELSFSHARPDFIHDAIRQGASLDRCQVITMPKRSDWQETDGWRRLTRQTIAMAYACGGHAMVPWDVYMPGDAPRYFGEPRHYADLYGFIRANSRYLDGYEYAGAFGRDIRCEFYGDRPPVRLPEESGTYAVVRAVPGQPEAPVVVHLVGWSEASTAVVLILDPVRLFGDRPLKMTLLVPADYGDQLHRSAETTGSYSGLSKSIPLESGYVTSVEIPALNPWGLLILEPGEATREGVWQPSIVPEPGGRWRETLRVSLTSATPGAKLHYTLDGSRPTAASDRYAEPIALTDTAVVQAIAVRPDGRTSSIASSCFRRLSGGPEPISPDSRSFKENLKLWLKADALALADGSPVATWPAIVGEDAVAEPHKAFGGVLTQPPTFVADAMRGRPAVRFDGVDDSLAIRGFANRYLAGKSFTVFMVTQSEDDAFGMCGNGIWGTGGEPRLYMQRSGFHYDKLNKPAGLRPASRGPTVSVFMHDGKDTISAASNGAVSEAVSGLPAVEQFGSGGNLAVPFWSGNRNCAGDLAEVIIFDRKLTDGERSGVEAYLADKYGILYVQRWE